TPRVGPAPPARAVAAPRPPAPRPRRPPPPTLAPTAACSGWRSAPAASCSLPPTPTAPCGCGTYRYSRIPMRHSAPTPGRQHAKTGRNMHPANHNQRSALEPNPVGRPMVAIGALTSLPRTGFGTTVCPLTAHLEYPATRSDTVADGPSHRSVITARTNYYAPPLR